MILEDEGHVKAALSVMHPLAREAVRLSVDHLFEHPDTMNDDDELRKLTIRAYVAVFVASGRDLDRDRDKFEDFIDSHAQNVLDISASIMICTLKRYKRQETLKNVGGIAALIGAAALGAFFG